MVCSFVGSRRRPWEFHQSAERKSGNWPEMRVLFLNIAVSLETTVFIRSNVGPETHSGSPLWVGPSARRVFLILHLLLRSFANVPIFTFYSRYAVMEALFPNSGGSSKR